MEAMRGRVDAVVRVPSQSRRRSIGRLLYAGMAEEVRNGMYVVCEIVGVYLGRDGS